MAPLVSVVIDNYNYGRFLRRAIESVLDQEFSAEVECIVVDDGSTDESGQVLSFFGDRIRVISQPNQGQATAFNTGFKAAQGEFVCMLDSDDYWARAKLGQIIPCFDDPAVGAVQHYLRDVTATGRPIQHRMPAWPPSYSIDDFLDHRVHFTAVSGLTFRKSVLDRILPLPKEIFYYIDDLLLVKALFLSKLANVPNILGFHRIHGLNYCAGGFQSPDKLALDIQLREVFHHDIQPWLAKHGKRYSRHYMDRENLEYFRRRILLYTLRGERRQAFREWVGLIKQYWNKRFGVFRAATCALALLSPQLYLKAYDLYSRWGLIAHLRFRLFPE